MPGVTPSSQVFAGPGPAPPVPDPDKTCVYVDGIDFHPQTALAQFATNDPVKCCAKCSATVDCVASVLTSIKGEEVCYLQAAQDVKGGPYFRADRIACVVKSKMQHKCETTPNIDYHPETEIKIIKASNNADCCDECQSYPGCVVGVFFEGMCYLKGAADIAGGAYTRSGRESCKPSNSTKRLPTADQLYGLQRANTSLAWINFESSGSTSPSPWGVKEHEEHGPYQHGGIFTGFNGGGKMFTPPVVVSVQPGLPIGVAREGYMRTETGCSVLSSFESMTGTLDESDWSMHSAPMHERWLSFCSLPHTSTLSN